MDPPTTQDSAKFSPGYGDFALQCSDGVICHFPRYLLAYMSGFFRDMFSLPEGAEAQSPNSSEPLKVTETGEIIELLLQHIDPKIRNPDMDPNTIVSLLEAARKYQVAVVTEWFEEEIKLKRVIVFVDDVSTQAQTEPLLVTNPLLVLYCAVRFDLPRPGQLALRELTHCNESLLQSTDHDLPLHVYLHGMDLRNKRVEFFTTFITELAALETDSKTPRASWPGSSRGRGGTPLNAVK
jgi:BTB/POZ domain